MKFSLKSFLAGALAATVGITTVFAAGGIKSAEFNSNKVFFNGNEISLSAQPMISLVKDGETAFSNYMPVRAVLEAMGYEVEWDEDVRAVNIKTKNAVDVVDVVDEVKTSPIAGSWIAETDEYKIQYHFHEDGHYHAHTELEEGSTFADGTYAVSGNAVTISVEKRIVDCENEELKETLDGISEIKFTFDFAEDGESWNASVEGLGNIKFVKDAETEAWANEHITHYN